MLYLLCCSFCIPRMLCTTYRNSSLPYRPVSCNLHILNAPLARIYFFLISPLKPLFLIYSKLPEHQLRDALIVSHLDSFHRRLPAVTVFFPKHAPNPRASVISVNDTNPADAFFRSMYLHIDCPFCLLCVFSMHVYLYDSARMP